MRTGTSGWPAGVARACSNSVWPGKGSPASDRDSLCKGAVTRARARPCCTRPAPSRTHKAAAAPASACTCPQGKASRPEGRPAGSQTGSTTGDSAPSAPAPGGAGRASERTAHTCSRAAAGCRPASAATARRITAADPITIAPGASPASHCIATISGPMPQGSPMDSTSGAGFVHTSFKGEAGCCMPSILTACGPGRPPPGSTLTVYELVRRHPLG